MRVYYDRDADGDIDKGTDSGIEISNIVEDADNNLTLMVTNPNKQGKIIGYDEGGFTGRAIINEYDFLQWAGIRVVINETALLSGVETVFPPSFWSAWDVTDYTIQIWEGWTNNKPVELLYNYTGDVQWAPEELRDGGWAFISLQNEQIIWNEGETYYVEINFNGTGGVYPFDKGVYSNSVNSDFSYFRGNLDEKCIQLTEIVDADWNIRAVISGDDDFEALAINIPEISQNHEIYSNYPNPFNPVTTLSIYLANPSAVSYTVFDLRGRQILQEEISLFDELILPQEWSDPPIPQSRKMGLGTMLCPSPRQSGKDRGSQHPHLRILPETRSQSIPNLLYHATLWGGSQ